MKKSELTVGCRLREPKQYDSFSLTSFSKSRESVSLKLKTKKKKATIVISQNQGYSFNDYFEDAHPKNRALYQSLRLLNHGRGINGKIFKLIQEFVDFSNPTPEDLFEHGLITNTEIEKAIVLDLQRDGLSYMLSGLRNLVIRRKQSETEFNNDIIHYLPLLFQSYISEDRLPSKVMINTILAGYDRSIHTVTTMEEIKHDYFKQAILIDLRWNHGNPILTQRVLLSTLTKLATIQRECDCKWKAIQLSFIQALREPFISKIPDTMYRCIFDQGNHYNCVRLSELFTVSEMIQIIKLDLKLDPQNCPRIVFIRDKIFHINERRRRLWNKTIDKHWSLKQAICAVNLAMKPDYYESILSDTEIKRISENRIEKLPLSLCKVIQSFLAGPLMIKGMMPKQRERREGLFESSKTDGSIPTLSKLLTDSGSAGLLLKSATDINVCINKYDIRSCLPPLCDSELYRKYIFEDVATENSLIHSALESDLSIGGGVWTNTLALCRAIDDKSIWNDLCRYSFNEENCLPIHVAIKHREAVPLLFLRLLLPSNAKYDILYELRMLKDMSEDNNSDLKQESDNCWELAIKQDSSQCKYKGLRNRYHLLQELSEELKKNEQRRMIRLNPNQYVRNHCDYLTGIELETKLISEGVSSARTMLALNSAL